MVLKRNKKINEIISLRVKGKCMKKHIDNKYLLKLNLEYFYDKLKN